MNTGAVEVVESGPRKVSRRVAVSAPPSAIFALVANPHRHFELDGSGTVRDTPVTSPDVMTVGSTFTVGMKHFGLPYAITSTVTAIEQDRVVEWRHPMGHRWRWELRGTERGTTEVTETFDYSTNKTPKLLELFAYPKKNGVGITKTLQALAARFA